MRTVRDNYYVVTGHTYEEYLKKFRHGIGKGKLLSFNEDEVKYLKKNKHYWEVTGPDGKILYCQVPKVRAKHIIIPSVIAVLIAGGVVGGIYIPKLLNKNNFTGEVTADEWKGSFENICNITEQRTLNYTAKGTIVRANETLTDLKVDGDYEEAAMTNSSKDVGNAYTYRFHQAPLTYDTVTKRVRVFEFLRDYTSSVFGDFYNNQNSFVFDKNEKAYTYDGSYVNNNSEQVTAKCLLKFSSDKKIKTIQCDATVSTVKIACDIEYTYGETKLEAWDEEFMKQAETYANKFVEDTAKNTAKTNAIGYESETNFLSYIESPKINGLNALFLYDNNNVKVDHATWKSGQMRIFKNGIELQRSDYTLIQESEPRTSAPEIIGYKLVQPLTKDDRITFDFKLVDSFYNKGYYLQLEIVS